MIMDNTLVLQLESEIIEVQLDPIKTPIAYQRKLYELIESGLTEVESKRILLRPIVLEIFYDINNGLFAVESEAVESADIYNPYSGEECVIEHY